MRLIGTVYFKKHATGFNTSSPFAHFLQFRTQSTSIEQQHMPWLDDIRQNIWDRIKFENEMLLHWQRSCRVIHMWEQADRDTMTLQPITQHGWTDCCWRETHSCLGHTREPASSPWQSEAVVKRVQVCNWLHNWEMWLQQKQPTLLWRMRV